MAERKRQVGGEKEAFWRGIGDYVGRFAFKSVATADFRRSMEGAAARDLGWFFDPWLMQPGLPRLHASHVWDEASRRLMPAPEFLQPKLLLSNSVSWRLR